MMKVILTLLLGALSLFASSANVGDNPDLTMTWVGFASLFIFVVGYYFVAAEEKYAMDKAKPALFIGTFMFLLVAIYYALNDLDLNFVNTEVNHLILEIAGIFFSYARRYSVVMCRVFTLLMLGSVQMVM